MIDPTHEPALLRSEDPDGLQCYSDHAHDIQFKGNCDMCGSADENVVGHVLPHIKRTTTWNPVEAARHVVDTGSALMVKGVLLDLFSASAILSIHDAAGERTKDKLKAMSLPQAVDICFRLINKLSS